MDVKHQLGVRVALQVLVDKFVCDVLPQIFTLVCCLVVETCPNLQFVRDLAFISFIDSADSGDTVQLFELASYDLVDHAVPNLADILRLVSESE